MAKFEQVWEHGRVVIRPVIIADEGARDGRSSGGQDKAERGMVAKVLESLRSAAAPAMGAPSVDQTVRFDGRAMEKALRLLGWQ